MLEFYQRSGEQLSERLATIGILTATRNTCNIPALYGIERFKGGPELGLHYAERREFLGQPMKVFPAYKFIFSWKNFKKGDWWAAPKNNG